MRNHIFDEQELRKIAYETIKGLNVGARMGFPHLNLEPKNILITSDGSIKLAHSLDSLIFGIDLVQGRNEKYRAPEETTNQCESYYKVDS